MTSYPLAKILQIVHSLIIYPLFCMFYTTVIFVFHQVLVVHYYYSLENNHHKSVWPGVVGMRLICQHNIRASVDSSTILAQYARICSISISY